MNTLKAERFEQVSLALQRKFGQQVMKTGRSMQTHQPKGIATGFPDLDEAIGGGGIPKQEITLLDGTPTSGMTTLAYRFIASAQSQKMVSIFLDLSKSFDPEYALEQCHVDPESLLLIYPHDLSHALVILRDILMLSYSGVVVLDTAFEPVVSTLLALQASLVRLRVPLKQSQWTLVGLLPQSKRWLVLPSSLHLTITRLAWQFDYEDVSGLETTIAIRKNAHQSSGKSVTVSLAFQDR